MHHRCKARKKPSYWTPAVTLGDADEAQGLKMHHRRTRLELVRVGTGNVEEFENASQMQAKVLSSYWTLVTLGDADEAQGLKCITDGRRGSDSKSCRTRRPCALSLSLSKLESFVFGQISNLNETLMEKMNRTNCPCVLAPLSLS